MVSVFTVMAAAHRTLNQSARDKVAMILNCVNADGEQLGEHGVFITDGKLQRPTLE